MMKRNHLSHRSVLSLRGKDRFTFLQGLITNDSSSLKTGEACWAAFLNTQGRIQSLFFVFATSEALLLDLPSDHAETMAKQLKRFRLRADVTIELTSFMISTGAPHAPPPERALCCVTDPRHPQLGWRAIMEERCSDATADEAYHERRLALGVPDMSDLGEPGSTLALEANMDALNGISWEKGCYLGQEVTARMHYRAHAKRRLLPITFSDTTPECGAEIFAHGQRIGDLRATHGKNGLAMVHRRAWNENTLDVSGTPAQLVWPDWLPTSLRPEEG